ncbi:hypothetical protein NCCP1664_14350 [Zafaria cholistanensis]|uniref:Uncharacterized protein n=1 Tax=Zafaria cholistanensis TaxID=1682741 RepID=A0A5A7NQF6_9MICC|nr:hypothetical protein [Zafaria cholistanensis]GER22939.1 hypothetical protein NCCP1664_14350 [Zafaria cholistanensis]
MRAPSSRTSKIVGFTAGPLAVLAAGAMVWQGSTAAFTANTSTANNWATGQITLTDNDVDGATFAVSGLAPGDTGAKCITVTATSTVNVTGNLYASVTGLTGGHDASSVDFSDRLMLKMEAGSFSTPGATAANTDCSDFLKTGDIFSRNALSTLASTTATTPAGAGSAPGKQTTVVVYKVSYDFDTLGLTREQENALMGQSTGATLVWELKAGSSA